MDSVANEVIKQPTGIPGFDKLAYGGLPAGRATMVTGTAGSGKTLLAIQFLVAGIREYDAPGVLVTFEESPEALIRNVESFGWDLAGLVETKKLAVVDASPTPGEDQVAAGDFDLLGLLARIEHAASTVGATRCVLDAVGSVFPQLVDAQAVRRELGRVAYGLRMLNLTTIITAERESDDGPISRHNVEEFVADNVVILRNRLEDEKRRRTLEILKFRGCNHQNGEYPFTASPDDGINILPLSAIELTQESSDVRVSSGNPVLDDMCGGGVFRDSVILVSGATGTGKTLMVTEFVQGACERGERALLFAFEESREQLVRNARSWGVDFAAAERSGNLKVVCRYPESMGLEDHLIQMRRESAEFAPHRIAVDSVSALERVGTRRAFREFVIGLTSAVKQQQVAAMLTNTTGMVAGIESITDAHISSITDSIILLRYVEVQGEVRRGIALLKMRGSAHDKQIREYMISDEGMTIKAGFRGISGILSGVPRRSPLADEAARLQDMFEPEG